MIYEEDLTPFVSEDEGSEEEESPETPAEPAEAETSEGGDEE